MKEKKNELWRLDLLEVKFTKVEPRFRFTRKLINARNQTVMKKLPSTPSEAFQQIEALKTDLFAKKYHGSFKKLTRAVARLAKVHLRKWTGDDARLTDLFALPEFMDRLVAAKLCKCVQNAVITKETRASPPSYIPADLRGQLTDKQDPRNPTHFFVTYCQNDKTVNNYLSKLWNTAELKTLVSEIEWSFRKIRGNLSKAELQAHEKSKKPEKKSESDDDSASDSDGDGSSDDEAPTYDEQKLAAFEQMVAGSDDESDLEEEQPANGADSDSGFFQAEPEKKAPKLPQLATGYFSGGSDSEDDVDNDKVVKAATTVRKNRRGQRARQKIWEQKYKTKANHVVKENQRIASERETKQQEFEERQRKRELKAKMLKDAEASRPPGARTQEVHPSWQAKKLAEKKIASVKFEGKKITFD